MGAYSLDSRRNTRTEISHAHDLISHPIRLLLELVARLVDRDLRLKQLVLKVALRGLIAEMRLPSQCRLLRMAGG
jgi:hypothetical protein